MAAAVALVMLCSMGRGVAGTALVLALALSAAAIVHQTTRRSADFATRYAGGVATARGLDPYASKQLLPIEHRLVGSDIDYVFRDPPPVAWAFRGLTVVPYGVAERLWLALLLVSAAVCARLALGLARARVHGLLGWGLLAALAVDFAPLREGISSLQLDPLIGALALVAAVWARLPGAGALQAIASMKPQAALLATVGGLSAGRLRFAAWLVAGWAALGVATVLAPGPSWGRWLDAVRSANRAHGAASVAVAVALAIAAAALATRAARAVRLGDAAGALAIAAAVNGTLAPLVFLNPQSDVLMLVPLLLLATTPLRTRGEAVALGCATGIFTTSGLFAVSYHSGVEHAAVPVTIAALLAVAAWQLFPAQRLAVATALAVNVAVTLPPLPPRVHDSLGAAASLVVLALLSR
ncbi:MAG: glycosyltransferase 87 family protein, partial [Gaiellaceae bacterium]